MLPNTQSSHASFGAAGAFGRVMIAVDDSKTSQRALEVGVALAKRLEAAVALVHVLDITRGFTPELGIMDDRLFNELRVAGVAVLDRSEQAVSPLGHSGAASVTRWMREGHPAAEIVKAADEWHADLLVLGTHAHGPVARFLLGSTAEAVVRRAHCPVLTVGPVHTKVNDMPSAAESTPARAPSLPAPPTLLA